MEVWINSQDQSPDEWARNQPYISCAIEGRLKVKLQDGRIIYSTWAAGKWSVERLKPRLKVVQWLMPVFKA